MPRKTRTDARRPPLSRDKVLRTALKMADRGGIDSHLDAQARPALKVEAMSLYNHVANKEAILDGLVELVAGEIDVPTIGGDWRDSIAPPRPPRRTRP